MKKFLICLVILALIVGSLFIGVVYKDNILSSADQFIETVKNEETQVENEETITDEETSEKEENKEDNSNTDETVKDDVSDVPGNTIF